MTIAHLVVVILALLSLGAAAFEVKSQRVNLIATGLFLWLLSTLLMGR